MVRRARNVVRGSRPARSRVPVGRIRTAGQPSAVRAGVRVHRALRVAAAYAWRLLVVGALVFVAFTALQRLQLVAVAVFVGLVLTALLRPPADLFARRMPRALAVVVAMVGGLLLFLGLLALVGDSVAREASSLGSEFRGGLGQIERWLERRPFHLSHAAASDLQGKVGTFLSTHRSVLISRALSGASQVVQVATGLALAVFCSVFFIHSGEGMWRWVRDQLPSRARSPWDRAGQAAWHAFAGYTRGIIIVAASNAALVGIALVILRVPLALPLTLLEFFATFIPLVGSPIAMAVATVVALAGRGPLTAALVLVLIVVIGQIEGHLLHPLVMSWAVKLHPVVIAVSVISGTIVAGVIGAVVAVPVISVAWSVIRELRSDAPGRQ
ncbi:putative PurR-regulated permease PerM [Streptacidiphilus sp. MAP12-16]|uniref:AI-2E family transporter n=1 Tax=Streptacidiphilus sp. MAP12-16 TaxID=3156300 RepID=UPI003517D709